MPAPTEKPVRRRQCAVHGPSCTTHAKVNQSQSYINTKAAKDWMNHVLGAGFPWKQKVPVCFPVYRKLETGKATHPALREHLKTKAPALLDDMAEVSDA